MSDDINRQTRRAQTWIVDHMDKIQRNISNLRRDAEHHETQALLLRAQADEASVDLAQFRAVLDQLRHGD